MWHLWHLWNLLHGKAYPIARCKRCGWKLQERLFQGLLVYVCPQEEAHWHARNKPELTAPAPRALVVREQTTGPMRPMDNHRMTHEELNTQQVKAIWLRNVQKARKL